LTYSNKKATKWKLVQFPCKRCIRLWPCEP
jgi:hypothetical protein